ncbi:MAG: DNA cytosine methyltransferase [Bacteroidales bacterium]
MKVLNLYAGLGGNRKLWRDVEVTAVELNPGIAKFYQDHFPEDTVIITDAHQYLLNHYKEFDFIWSSINCPSHSRARFWASKGGRYNPVYPDMKLYEEIIFLKHFFSGKWSVENVTPYYEPLIEPTIKIERHLFWTNFPVNHIRLQKNKVFDGNIESWQNDTGFDITGYDFGIRKDKVLRNCVNPELGLHILNCALNIEKTTQKTIFDELIINSL